MTRLLGLALACALVMSACTGPETSPSATPSGPPRGGTLHLMSSSPGRTTPLWDPANYVWGPHLEFYRCCLLRTLYSYPGLPAEEGGGLAQPDLAEDYPEVSSDGLRWTIHLKEGIRYAPPYDELTVTSPDIVAGLEHLVAFERAAPQLGGIGVYYAVIRGFGAFAAGEASSITGIETPDDRTLVIQLTEPAGDLVDRLAFPHSAPIPAGAADDHPTDYVRYLAASGPYMFEGADSLNAAGDGPVLGWTRDHVTLVRNPSWDPATDQLRAASPDRIELRVVASDVSGARLRAAFLEGGSDLVIASSRNLGMIERGRLLGRVETDRTPWLEYLAMNVAVPPFDDVHVRRAVNLALDRSALARATEEEGGLFTRPTWHVLPASLESFRVPDGWRPSWAEEVPMSGSLAAARREMRRSAYDADGDGRCDGPGCRPLVVIRCTEAEGVVPFLRALRPLGIDPRVDLDEGCVQIGVVRPGRRAGAVLRTSWLADYANASTFFIPLFYGPSILPGGNAAFSMLGAEPDQLRGWGYEVTSVPSVDDRIDRCRAMIGEVQQRCWTDLDLYVSEEIVPWAPLYEYEFTRIVSDRVTSYSFDGGLAFLPAYDRFVLAPDGGEPA